MDYCCDKAEEVDFHKSYNHNEKILRLDPGWMCMFDGPIVEFEYCMFCGKKLG